VSSIEERLAVLETEREIMRTMQAYGHSLDYGDEDEWIDCWLEGAVLHWPNPPYTKAPFRGHDELLGAFRGHTHAPVIFHKHVIWEPRIEIDGDSARVETYYARLDDCEDDPYIRSYGRYLDVLKSCPDGRWRFEERRAHPEAASPRPRPGGEVR
jgi:hypothetical protein